MVNTNRNDLIWIVTYITCMDYRELIHNNMLEIEIDIKRFVQILDDVDYKLVDDLLQALRMQTVHNVYLTVGEDLGSWTVRVSLGYDFDYDTTCDEVYILVPWFTYMFTYCEDLDNYVTWLKEKIPLIRLVED